MRRETDMDKADINPGLAKLREEILEYHKLMKKRKDRSHKLLAEQHSKKTQFIFEFLQNAEDKEAKFVHFDLSDKELLIRHDGKKVFTYNNVDSITNFGDSDKEGKNDIGKFGVGFKSVFNITDSPIIHSGKYHFKIEDYILPEEVKPKDIGKETLFILRLKNDESQNIKQTIIKGFEETKSENLLFLKNIQRITFSYKDKKWNLHIKRKSLKIPQKYKKDFKVTETTVGDGGDQHYLVIEPIKSVRKTSHKIKIALLKEKRNLVSVAESPVFVFFPTSTESYLPFLVQAPYGTTPSRENLCLDDEDNQEITKSLGRLVADSLPLIRDIGLLSTDVLRFLPVNERNGEEPYSTVREAVTEKMKQEKLLPGVEVNTYLHPKECLFTKDKELTKLLKPHEIKDVMYKWVSTDIPDNIRQILSIEEFSLEKFAEKLDKEFISKKDDKWLNNFYGIFIEEKESELKPKFYGRYREIIDLFKEKPILRLQNGDYVSPFDSKGNLQVFRPYESNSESSSFKIIDKEILKQENAKKLFEYLGIKEPDEKDWIQKDILPKYENENHQINEEYHLKNIARIAGYKNDSDITKSLKNLYIIRTETGIYSKPDKTFLQDEITTKWFKDNKEIEPVKELKWTEKNNKEIKEMFVKIGCFKDLEYDDGKWEWDGEEWKKTVRHGTPDNPHKKGEDGFKPNFKIYGLQYSLENINEGRSKILWSFLLKYYDHLRGKVSCSSQKNFSNKNTCEMFSEAGQTIQKHNWLYDKKNELIQIESLGNYGFEDLNEMYEKGTPIARDTLARALGMRPEVVTRKEYQEKAEENTQLKQENEELKAELKQLKQPRSSNYERSGVRTPGEPNNFAEEPWKPEREPNGSSKIYRAVTPTLSPRTSSPRQNNSTREDSNNSRPTKPNLEAGRWGEEEVLLALQKKYLEDEVVWMNEAGESSKPYDISISRKGNLDIFVEVKTTISSPPHTFEITGPQWEHARRCQNQMELGEYQICTVFNAGGNETGISLLENPFDQFKADKLDVRYLGLRLDLGDPLE